MSKKKPNLIKPHCRKPITTDDVRTVTELSNLLQARNNLRKAYKLCNKAENMITQDGECRHFDHLIEISEKRYEILWTWQEVENAIEML